MEPEDEEACAEPTAVGSMPRSVINEMMADAERREARLTGMLRTDTPSVTSGVHVIDLRDRGPSGTLPFFSESEAHRLPHDTDVDPVELELEELLSSEPDPPAASTHIALAIQQTLASETARRHQSVPFPILPVTPPAFERAPAREPLPGVPGVPGVALLPRTLMTTLLALVALGLGASLSMVSLSGWLAP
jgi:hypothetical protein